MKYYKLLYCGDNGEDYINCEHYEIGDKDSYCLNTGTPIYDWEGIVFSYNSCEGKIISDYISNSLDWFIVTEKFERLLDSNGYIPDTCQALPVDVQDESGLNRTITAYAINIIDYLFDAIDFEKSDYSILRYEDIEMTSIRKFVLKQEMISGHDIFCLKESPMYKFVSEKIKNLITDNELTGFDFIEVSVV